MPKRQSRPALTSASQVYPSVDVRRARTGGYFARGKFKAALNARKRERDFAGEVAWEARRKIPFRFPKLSPRGRQLITFILNAQLVIEPTKILRSFVPLDESNFGDWAS